MRKVKTEMIRKLALSVACVYLVAELMPATPNSLAKAPQGAAPSIVDMFDAMQNGDIEAKFIARNSLRGRLILSNKTNRGLNVGVPDAFIGVPANMAQFGGGGMGGGGGGFGGGGQTQTVGGGGGGGFRGGGGRGGGGRGGGGRGGFSIPPEKTIRIDVPLLCLEHGKKEPSSSKPYVVRPIENFIDKPEVIEVVRAYSNGNLPTGAAQAAVWNLNSGVGWDELAAKKTGTERNVVRKPYFSSEEIQAGMAIAQNALSTTAGKKVEPRAFSLPGEKSAEQPADSAEQVSSPGDELNEPAGEPAEEAPQDDDPSAPLADRDTAAAA